MRLPNTYPIVALHFAASRFKRAERGKALAINFKLFQIRADLRQNNRRFVLGHKRLNKHVAPFGKQIFVHIVPIHSLVFLQSNNVFNVGNGNAVIGVPPKNIGYKLAPFGGGVDSKFGKKHSNLLFSGKVFHG